MMKYLSSALLVSAFLVLAACEKDGPAERAGEALDEAVEDARTKAEELAEETDQALEDAQNQVEATAEEVREDIETAEEKLNDVQ